MITPETLQQLWDMSNEDLRAVMAHAAAIHVHNDGGDNSLIVIALMNIVRGLKEQQFRGAAA